MSMSGATYGTAIRNQDHDDGYDEASKTDQTGPLCGHLEFPSSPHRTV
jgi:hypothetical protein